MLRLAGSLAGLGLASHLAGQKVKAESLPWQTEESHSRSPVSLDFSWVLDSKARESPSADTPSSVLVLAYPRTGSTLLGEILAAHPHTSYFMEPLFAMMPVGQLDWEYVLEGKIERGEVPSVAVTALMQGIFSCEESVVTRLEDWSKAPHTSVTSAPLAVCRSSNSVLAKTVRLHGPVLGEVVSKLQDLQVVHIVRDPRAVSASLQAQQEEWGELSAETYCRHLLADLALEDQLGPERYLRVRYEDFVQGPEAELERIGAFTGVPVTEEMREAVAVKMFGKVEQSKSRCSNDLAATNTTDYYSTVRPPGHKTDSWRSKLHPDQVAKLECGVCREVMERLGYKRSK